MNIQVNIFHPAHFHLFKNFIREMRFRGHKIVVCARNKEVTHKLLQGEGFEFYNLGDYQTGILNRLQYIANVCVKLRKIIKHEEIECLVGVSDMYGGLASKYSRVKAISFTDTDHAWLINLSTRIFADHIVTPQCCTSDFGAKQICYDGYHELAYLHPDYFTPDASVLQEHGLKEGEHFVILRLVSWNATHDLGQEGLSLKNWQSLIAKLSGKCKIIISSEREIPADFEPYRFNISPTRMHHLLAYADLFIGEGATMASECAILGTPAIYVNSLDVAYCTELEEQYGLVFNFRETIGVEEKAMELLSSGLPSSHWLALRQKVLDDKTDVTAFMISCIERMCKNNTAVVFPTSENVQIKFNH